MRITFGPIDSTMLARATDVAAQGRIPEVTTARIEFGLFSLKFLPFSSHEITF